MDADDPFDDMDALRLPEELQALPGPRGTATKQRPRFIRFPYEWAERLKAARRISTYRVALHLLYRDYKTGGRPVTLSNKAAGLSGKEKWRGLRELEDAGLVRVERRARRSPIVTLLRVP